MQNVLKAHCYCQLSGPNRTANLYENRSSKSSKNSSSFNNDPLLNTLRINMLRHINCNVYIGRLNFICYASRGIEKHFCVFVRSMRGGMREGFMSSSWSVSGCLAPLGVVTPWEGLI